MHEVPGSWSARAQSLRAAPLIIDDTADTLPLTPTSALALIGDATTELSCKQAEEMRSKAVINTGVPFCAVVCGTPGSGKTQTLVKILGELTTRTLSSPRPTALVCHVGVSSSSSTSSPCELLEGMEASALLSSDCQRNVFVPHAALDATRVSYRSMPSVHVHPLRLAAKNITLEAALRLLGICPDDSIFLDVMATLDVYAMWDYRRFRKRILTIDSHPGNIVRLQRRLVTLDACIVDAYENEDISDFFSEGSINVLDLSSLGDHMDTASALFEHVMQIFTSAEVTTRRILAIDDFDKLLVAKTKSSSLCASVIDLVQNQHHHNVQVLVSTRDPTRIPADILALSTVTIIHRLWSPAWLDYLSHHVGPIHDNLRHDIARLDTGHAVFIAPTAIRLSVQNTMDTASSDDIEITRMVYTPVVVSMHRGVSLPPISPVRPEYQSASPQMVPFSPGVVGLPPASASNASLSIAPQDARGDTVLVPVSSPRALPLPGDTHMPGPRASTPSIGYLAREPGGCVVGTSETDTSDALEDTRPGSSSTTKSSVFEVDAADLSRDFQPLVNGLAHVKGYVHFHILFYNLRAFPGVPKDLRTFDCWIQVAETLGLVARIGDEICLQQMSDGYKTQSTITSDTEAQTSPAVSHNEGSTLEELSPEVPNRFSPLANILIRQELAGYVRTRRSIISSMLCETPPSWLTASWRLTPYLEDAQGLKLVSLDNEANSGDGWVCLSQEWRARLLPPHVLTSLPTAASDRAASSNSSNSDPSSSNPMSHMSGEAGITEAVKDHLGQFLPLVELLLRQRKHGWSRTYRYYISKTFKQQAHLRFGTDWNVDEYLADAALRGLVAVDPSTNGADACVSLLDNWQATLPSERFTPLRALCASRYRVNISQVDRDLKKSHRHLIPSGNGAVRAYLDAAVSAGVVSYTDKERQWVRLQR